MKRDLTFGQKMFCKIVQPMNKLTLGYTVPFMEDFVRTYGLKGAMRGMTRVQTMLALLEAELGDLKAAALVGFGAFWNGCPWCSIGHILAANLIQYDEDETFFFVDELEVPYLQTLRDDDVFVELRKRAKSDFDRELIEQVERQYALKMEKAQPVNEMDELLIAGLQAWDWFNECTIVNARPADKVPAIHKLWKKRRLVRAYQAARAPFREENPLPKDGYYRAH